MASKRPQISNIKQFDPEFFLWEVHSKGYMVERRQWAELSRPEERREGDVVVAADSFSKHCWQPLTKADFFRQLAGCKTTASGIRDFANQYGLLGIPVLVAPAGTEEFLFLDPPGEWIRDWTNAVATLRGVVGIWDALADGRCGDLHRWVLHDREMDDPGKAPKVGIAQRSSLWHFAAQDDQGRWTLAYSMINRDRDADQEVDRAEAARLLMVQMTNQQLKGHCVPYLKPRPFRTQAHTLHMAPRTLLGAAWWQLARLLAGESTHRPCKACGQLIELSTTGEGFRADKEYCSNACKLKGHRLKVREMKAMKASGKTFSLIAKHFDADTDAVKRLLAKPDSRRTR